MAQLRVLQTALVVIGLVPYKRRPHSVHVNGELITNTMALKLALKSTAAATAAAAAAADIATIPLVVGNRSQIKCLLFVIIAAKLI